MRNPEILILDEATSALDGASEALINEAIERASRGRTLLSITHRLASVRTADVIFFLDHGRIVEAGKHEELLARNGGYARMWKKQSGFMDQGEGLKVEPERLRDIPILAELEDSVLAEMAQGFLTERYSPNRYIVHEGDPGDKFYILARGTAEVWKRDRRTTVLQDGDYFGEMALILHTRRNASVRAVTECTCLMLPHDRFQALMTRVPSLRWRLRELAAINEYVNAEAAIPVTPETTHVSSKIRHDLLTPVNHLIGYSELLLEDLPESPHIADIRSAAKNAQGMIERALPSGQAASRSTVETLRSDIEAPIQTILGLVAQAAAASPIGIESDLEKLRCAAQTLRAMFDDMDHPAQAAANKHPSSGGTALAGFRESSLGHLLVVDDNDRSRDLLQRRLERHGYRVSQAAGGRQALEMISAGGFDLVLLDVMMPEMDGYEVLRQLRVSGQLSELPVIVTSALDEVESAVRCIELGAEDYLTKPFHSGLLETRIAASVAQKRVRSEERRKAEELRNALEQLQGRKYISGAAS